jgi:CheY-like chemotaxis protein
VSERRILVAEHEHRVTGTVATRLCAGGFAVADRRRRARRSVVDVLLPGFDSLEACRRIGADRPVPVLMPTARDGDCHFHATLRSCAPPEAVGFCDAFNASFAPRQDPHRRNTRHLKRLT